MSDILRTPPAPVHPIARVAGALHVIAGITLLIVVAVSFLPDPPPPGERQYGNGSWGWVFTVFLIPPGALIVGIGIALWQGWLRLGFLLGEVIVVVGSYTVAVLS